MSTRNLSNKLSLTLSILAILIALSAFVLGWVVGDQHFKAKASATWDSKLIFACYNNQIQTCDDAGVQKWNKAHPDKAITAEYLRQAW